MKKHSRVEEVFKIIDNLQPQYKADLFHALKQEAIKESEANRKLLHTRNGILDELAL